MPAVFVHVSDIHFGQERDHTVHIHDDVKLQLITDAGEIVRSLPSGVAQGILVTGDIAHSGVWGQYEVAGHWLDRLAAEIGCPIHRVQMVPGNHDLDRNKLTVGGKQLLDYIRNGGAAEYEQVVADPTDRGTLLRRFEDYDRFSVGYGCALDEEGKFATNLRIELAPDRFIRIIRLNSSLLCTGDEKDDNPELMIGARQFTIPAGNAGEENIVLVHHPLNWYKDADEAKEYIRARTRVFISGHEHNPKVTVDTVEDGRDLLMLAAGATVPFKSTAAYTFTYNIIAFDWDSATDALAVTIYPRAWNTTMKRFEADDQRLGGAEPKFVLGSPNFRRCRPLAATTLQAKESAQLAAEPVVELVPTDTAEETDAMAPIAEGAELALLRFFRDLVESERLRILVDLDALEADSDERMTQGLERRLFGWLVQQGRLAEITKLMDRLIADRKEGEA